MRLPLFFVDLFYIKNTIFLYIYIYIYILGVARYTEVTARYVPRFGVTVWYNFDTTGKKFYYALFLFIYFEQTVVQITISKNLNVLFSLCRPLYSDALRLTLSV